MSKELPFKVDDGLIHIKDNDNTNDDKEHVIMPITSYKNILSAPNVVKASNEVYGAPYLFLKTGDSEELSVSKIRDLAKDGYIL